MTKVCAECRLEKIKTDFTVDRSRYDGRHRLCKTCLYRRQDLYRSKPGRLEAIRAYKKRYDQSERGRQRAYENSKKHSKTVNGRFSCSKSRAKRNGLSWTLTKEQYTSLVSRPCDYCGGPLPTTSTGLDRLDNSLGYDFENVSPCCALCNYARRDQFTVEEMKQIIGPAIAVIRARRIASRVEKSLS